MDPVSSPGYSSSLSQLSVLVDSPSSSFVHPVHTRSSTHSLHSSEISHSAVDVLDEMDQILWSARLRVQNDALLHGSQSDSMNSTRSPKTGFNALPVFSSSIASPGQLTRANSDHSMVSKVSMMDSGFQTEEPFISSVHARPFLLSAPVSEIWNKISREDVCETRSVQTGASESIEVFCIPVPETQITLASTKSTPKNGRQGSRSTSPLSKTGSQRDVTSSPSASPTPPTVRDHELVRKSQFSVEFLPPVSNVRSRSLVESVLETEIGAVRSYCASLENSVVRLASIARSGLRELRSGLDNVRMACRELATKEFESSLSRIDDQIRKLSNDNDHLRSLNHSEGEQSALKVQQLEGDVAYWTNQFDTLQANHEERERELQQQILELNEQVEQLESREKLVAERARLAAESDILVLKLRADWRDMRDCFSSNLRFVLDSLSGLNRAFSKDDCSYIDSVVRQCQKPAPVERIVRDALVQTVPLPEIEDHSEWHEELALGDDVLPEYSYMVDPDEDVCAFIDLLSNTWSNFRPLMADTLLCLERLRQVESDLEATSLDLGGIQTPNIGSDLDSYEIRYRGDAEDFAEGATDLDSEGSIQETPEIEDETQRETVDEQSPDDPPPIKEPPDDLGQDAGAQEEHPKADASGEQTVARPPEAGSQSDEKSSVPVNETDMLVGSQPEVSEPLPPDEPEEVDPEFLEFLGADADDFQFHSMKPAMPSEHDGSRSATPVRVDSSAGEGASPGEAFDAQSSSGDRRDSLAISPPGNPDGEDGLGHSAQSDFASPLALRDRQGSAVSFGSAIGASSSPGGSMSASRPHQRALTRHTSYALSAASAKFRALMRFQQQLEQGVVCEKHCRNVEPHRIKLYLGTETDCMITVKYGGGKKVSETFSTMHSILWDSLAVDGNPARFKKRRRVPLIFIRKFILGQYTPVFKRQPFPDDAQFDRSLSFVYVTKAEDMFVDYDVLLRKENATRMKTLDLVFPSRPFRDNAVQLFSAFLEQVHDELEVLFKNVMTNTPERTKERVLMIRELKRVTPEYGEPLVIDKMPDVTLLDENEFQFCSKNHIFPSQFLRLKQRFVRLAIRGRPPPESDFVAMGVLDALRTAKTYAFLCNFAMPS